MYCLLYLLLYIYFRKPTVVCRPKFIVGQWSWCITYTAVFLKFTGIPYWCRKFSQILHLMISFVIQHFKLWAICSSYTLAVMVCQFESFFNEILLFALSSFTLLLLWTVHFCHFCLLRYLTFLWVSQTFMPDHPVTAFSVLKKLFSPGWNPTSALCHCTVH